MCTAQQYRQRRHEFEGSLMSEVMRPINLIVVHCSATREDRDFTEYDLDVCHRRRGFNGAGYHFYIRKNGDIKSTRAIEKIGINAKYMDILI